MGLGSDGVIIIVADNEGFERILRKMNKQSQDNVFMG